MHRFDNLSCLDTALNTGAFLSSGDNVMVISWGMIGVMWGKKVFVAPVRDSRYTKEFIDKSGTFTVSVPPMREMLDAVKFCGTKSGREYDKWAECSLEKVKAKITEQQARLKELEQKKVEAENSEIVDIVRGMSIPLAELPVVLQQIRAGATLGQNVPKSETEDKEDSE